ncbi:class I SAM-dependent methyltransferase [Clostridium estertheticum]|uniref:class I SAM-dependent methyltransferase n=1 Tax=Clostridium estertheticum TaxID=238834 RepID=UPI001C6E3612|nr:class I SAM-dependent methyltransferase [Clostridium estertheticum]MBW9173896.1 class I SAM-dependent methyltransferase [Clostridium estertheticum]WLC74908.1 class I SAM-dependent methyltransferase [Clostridium estertheticum]
MQEENNLFNRIINIQNQVSSDFGGGSPLSECYIMAYLASSLKFKNYVEIGVYKGRSLFSVALAFQDNNGKAYGIDPYALDEAKEYDLEENFKNTVNSFLEGLDFDEMYKNVFMNREKFKLDSVVEIIRKTSIEAVYDFKNIEIDMLHIDGNHDTKNVREDINNYSPLIRDGGIVIFDDIDWESVKTCYAEVKIDYIILLETNNYAILMKKEKNSQNLDSAEIISKNLNNLYLKLVEIESKPLDNNRKLLAFEKVDRNLEIYDLLIIDDVFPHPVSGFRYQEFLSYLENLNSIKVLTTGLSVHVLGKETIDDLIIDFKKRFTHIEGRLEKFVSLDNIECKLLYLVFLNNAISLVDMVEMRKIPFIFTLYPGGGFGLNNFSSDNMLKRVVESPCFRKVIVTQKVTYDYLIDKNFCKPEQIEYIFGVVTPLDKVERDYTDKKHFGIDKEILDICFVAHKYTQFGQDKGYDIFVEVAKGMLKMYTNINFHVVGNFDEKVIDISEIKDKITFYGIQLPNWFDEFYKDKDIVISPNIPGMIYTGSFDGFPTASCTDAGLCKTAIFCTDPLELNNSLFKDGEQIVIIEHNISRIIKKIEYYYSNPEELRNVGESGYDLIKNLYGFDSQIAPRIKLLKAELLL